MARLSILYCLLLTCSWHQMCYGNPYLIGIALAEKVSLVTDVYQKFDSWLGKKPSEISNADLLGKMGELSVDMDQMKSEIMDKISDLQDKVTVITNKFYSFASDIQNSYEKFLEYVRNGDKYQMSTLQDFAQESTTHGYNGMDKTLGRMYDLFFNKNYKDETFISTITRDSTAADILCLRNLSKQQLINDFFEALVNSTLKGLLVTAYSYDVKARFDNNASYRNEQVLMQDTYLNRTHLTFEKVKHALRSSSRTLWKCDPLVHKKDVTYGKLEQVFQSYFAYDIDLSDADTTNLHLEKNCKDIKNARLNCRTDRCRAQHYNKWCIGKIRDCADVSRNFQVCHADVDSERKYEWARIDQSLDKADYGVFNKDACYTTQGLMTNRILEYFSRDDDICTCICETDDRKIDRYFSLRDVLSDENKVVTGAKLTLDNHVFHIQIQQGTLGPNGTITDKPEWKKVDTIPKAQLLTHNVSRYINRVPEGRHWFKNDLVYSVSYEQSIVYLDNLEDKDPNRLVTGLRFQHVDNYLRLEIQTSPFDYATGKLNRAAYSWIPNNKTIKQRHEVKLTEPGNPAEISGNNVISSEDKYVHFQMTDLKKDVGSWTVPLIDFQEVITTPPMPLAGAGLIHRGKKESGGFLALGLSHYDFSAHI